MPFFEDVDNMGLIERHIRRVTGLEMEQARNLLRVYTKARKQLLDQLHSVPNDTFTEAQMTVVLRQVEAAIEAMKGQLSGETRLGAELMAEQSAEDAIKEVERFEREFVGVSQNIPVQSVLASLDSGNLLLNKFGSSIETYNESVRNAVQQELTQLVIQRTNYFTAIQRIGDKIPHFRSPIAWQVQRIARTELHNIYNVSKMQGFAKVRDDFLPDLKKTLIHPMDSRTDEDSKALAKENPIVPIDEPFRFEWNGETRVFMAPPDRPNDRAILVPYREAWENDE